MDTKLFRPHKVTHATKRKTPKALEFSLNVKILLGSRRKQYAARLIHLWQELSAIWKRKKKTEARLEEKKKKKTLECVSMKTEKNKFTAKKYI